MEKPLSLTLLYTANIGGDLELLPRLYTFLQQLKPAARQGTLLLDLGGSCADSAWHCRETGGRSTLIVLDGMGFHAANVEGLLDRENHDKLAAQVTMGLVDETRDWRYHVPPVRDSSIRAALQPRDESARLQIHLAPSGFSRIEGKIVYLQDVSPGQVGETVVDLRAEPSLRSSCVHQMPADTPPNPSIAGTVEFVEAEARLLARKKRVQARSKR